MKIQSILPYRANRILNNPKNIQKDSNKQVAFTSIFADANPRTLNACRELLFRDMEYTKMLSCSTRLFRELPTQTAIAGILKPDNKNEIKILGCSDGSEAWAYAIMMNETHGAKAKENTKIKAVDIEYPLLELARTGKVVCSTIEKQYANATADIIGGKSPLKGDGWDKYLKLSKAPACYKDLKKAYPFLKYLTLDPIVQKTIGNGLNWYEINKEDLPPVEFRGGDMLDNLAFDDDSDAVVYVVANSASYLYGQSPDKFIGLFEKIKEENKDKNKDIYVVIGMLEESLLSPYLANSSSTAQAQRDKIRTRRRISELGFENIPIKKLKKIGIDNYTQAGSRIYRLNNKK